LEKTASLRLDSIRYPYFAAFYALAEKILVFFCRRDECFETYEVSRHISPPLAKASYQFGAPIADNLAFLRHKWNALFQRTIFYPKQ
jgi:hypothetical protein